MKSKVFLSLMLLIVSMFLCVPHTAAEYESYTQWGLPEGAKARLGKGSINEIAYSPDGTRLAVASSINIWIYDAQTGEELALLIGHQDEVRRVMFSPDSTTLVSVGWDGTVLHLWDVATATLTNTIKQDRVGSMVFSPDSTTLASGWDGTVHLYAVDTGTSIRTLQGHTGFVNSVVFSPDGKTLASRGGWNDEIVRLWDVETGNHRMLEGHTGGVTSVAFSPDGKTLTSGGVDGKVRLWNVATATLMDTLIGHEEVDTGEGFSSAVYNVVFSPDGTTLASSGVDGKVRLCDVATGDPQAVLSVRGSVYFTPDGKTLVSEGYDAMYLWDVATGILKATLTAEEPSAFASINSTFTLNSNGTTLSRSDWDGTVLVWDVATGDSQNTITLAGHSRVVLSVTFSPDGNTLASSGWDSKVRLWDVATGKNKTTLRGHEEFFTTLTGSNSSVYSVTFSPDGTTLASGGADETVRLWDIATGTLTETLDEATWESGINWVWSIAFSPDGTTLASGGWDDSKVRLWDVATGTLTNTLTPGGAGSLAFSPDGGTLVSGGYEEIRLWDAASGAPIRTLEGHTSYVNSVSFSPDGKTLASGSGGSFDDDNTVRLWDVVSGASIRTLEGHTDQVNSVSFSPDGKTLASGSEDKTIRLWNVVSGVPIRTLEGHTGNVNSVSFSPDGQTLASGSDDGTILLWDITPVDVPTTPLSVDVNGDGVVNAIDLVIVAVNFGTTEATAAQGDVNGDGEVNREDILAVLDALAGEDAVGAPEAVSTVQSLQRWIDRAKQLNRIDATFQKGIAILEQLLATWGEAELVPKQTALLANYPNPFNPETWIPYQLAESADVSISIYATDGQLVRKIQLGHKVAGIYQSRSRAAHWDGRNAVGEPVESGVYFYSLSVGDFSATRKMLITK